LNKSTRERQRIRTTLKTEGLSHPKKKGKKEKKGEKASIQIYQKTTKNAFLHKEIKGHNEIKGHIHLLLDYIGYRYKAKIKMTFANE